MGREVITKGIQFPVSQKSPHVFLMVGCDSLSDIETNQKLAAKLEEISVSQTGMRISFCGRVSANRITDGEAVIFDEALAILSGIKNQYQLPVVCNLGDWSHLEKAASVADILLIEDYLALCKSNFETFLTLKKPFMIDHQAINELETQTILTYAEKYKVPASLLSYELSSKNMIWHESYFICLKMNQLNEKIIRAALMLGMKGFYLTFNQKNLQDLDQIIKILSKE